MRCVKLICAVISASLLSSAALAADLPIDPPPAYVPPPADFGGWYLRGDIGFANPSVKRLDNALDATLLTQNQQLGFDSAGIYGFGVGYQFNGWFRFDITGQYRGSAHFHGLDVNTFPTGGGGVGFGSDTYSARTSGWLVLANAYADLGTWWRVTPFIGAGVGTSRLSVSNFVDQGLINSGAGSMAGTAFADNTLKWNFAWAAYAGFAYQVTHGMTLELAYRYVDLGNGMSGDIRRFDGINEIFNPTTFRHITSQDLTLGVRWLLEPTPIYMPPPAALVRKG
jgi:opacity protein-like surface antigen